MPPRSSQRQNAPNTSNQRPICVFYKQGAGCWKKDKCSFRHIERRNNQNGSTASNSLFNPVSTTSTSDQVGGIHVPNNPTPCKFFASGFCHRGASCWFTHIDPSNVASTNTTSTDPTQSGRVAPSNVNPATTSHSSGDSSSKKECGICMEIPDNYGLLENCQHAFCISCIREWRRGNDSSNDQGGGDSLAGKKTCPSCRTKSNLCIPSSLYHPPGPFKETIIENYKASCSSKPCHNYMRHKNRAIDAKCKDQYGGYFERMTALQRSAIRAELSREVKGKCIFGDDCLYSHEDYKFGKGFEELQREAVERRARRSGGRRRRGGRDVFNPEDLLDHLMERVNGMTREELEMMMQVAGLDLSDDSEDDELLREYLAADQEDEDEDEEDEYETESE